MAKRAYTRVAKAHGVDHFGHYYANNCRFNDKICQDDCDNTNQTYSHYGVGAHHQNGLAESKNKILSYGARKLLLHARKFWPQFGHFLYLLILRGTMNYL